MKSTPERLTLGTTTPIIHTSSPASTARVANSASSFTDDTTARQSVDTIKTVRSQHPVRKPVPKRAHSPQIPTDNHSDEADRENYYDNSPAPTPSQFLGARGRPLSFYDMKTQQKQARPAPAPAPMSLRNSWRASGEMPFNYADIIGDSRNSGYNPPRMGRSSTQPTLSGPMPDATQMYLGLPWTMWMNSEFKNLFVASVGEWVGTTLFLFFAFAGTQVANAHSKNPEESTTTNATAGFSPIVMLYISVAFGFSLMVNVWIFFRISGGLFNPAATLGLWAVGAVAPVRAVCLCISQIIGSITASALVLAMFPTPLNVRTTLSTGTSLAQGVFIEALMTAELVFTILMLAKEKHKSTFIAPIGIGLALFVAELVGVYYTGGSLNPARSLGPCIVTNKYDSEHWIYWVGPGLGSLLAVGFYKFIKMLEYEMANPGQDGDDDNDPTKNPNHEVREKQRLTTAKVLQSLGYPHPGDEQGTDASLDTMRQVEEGAFYGNRTVSGLNMDEPERRGPSPGPALSTVASMSDLQSPVRTDMHSPTRSDMHSQHSPMRPGYARSEATATSSEKKASGAIA
ncbi:unnamed protein product [Periconia digitata]|uniref:Aquaporin-like protein n=1 Tax=Periconia digitata TaxID=1303443 RepID=A0A9W4XQ16_9PLEO|nr:unnamed protein product [Periconia digitata]